MKIEQVVTSLIQEINQAQMDADHYLLSTAKQYKISPELSGMPIPRMKMNEVNLDIPITLSLTEHAPLPSPSKLLPLLYQLGYYLLKETAEEIRLMGVQSTEKDTPWQNDYYHDVFGHLYHDVIEYLVALQSERFESAENFSKKLLSNMVDDILLIAQKHALYDNLEKIDQLSVELVKALQFTLPTISEFLTKIQALYANETTGKSKIEVDVETRLLNQARSESQLGYIKIHLVSDEWQWQYSESSEGKIDAKLNNA